MAKQKRTDITKMTQEELITYSRRWIQSRRVKTSNDVRFVQAIVNYWDTNRNISKDQHAALMSKLWVK